MQMNDLTTVICTLIVVFSASILLMFPPATQYVAALFGMLGAALLATHYPPGWGFGAFLVSNVGWIMFSYKRQQWGHLAQMCVFMVTSLVGLWNWWLGPLVLGGGT